MHDLEVKVQNTINKYNMFSKTCPVIVGVSGGADSICLATVLKKLGYNLVIAHINHNIRGNEAKRDEDFVRNFANQINCEFKLLSEDVVKKAKDKKISEEMAGREVRYTFFGELSHFYHTNFIAVAHNKNDSAETVLINLIRGAALNGHKGIVAVNGNIYRPLIEVTRCEIEAYLSENNIEYVVDSTNNEMVYTRNIIRNDIMKTIEKINPNVINTLVDNANIIKDDNEFLNKITLEEAKKRVIVNDDFVELDILSKEIDIAIKRRLILYAINVCLNGANKISSDHVNSILNLNNGKQFILGNTLNVRNNHGKLFFSKPTQNSTFEYELTIGEKTYIKEIDKTFIAEFTDTTCKESNCIYIDYDKIGDKIILRSRKTGDKFSPAGLGGRQSIKDYFINNKMPHLLRDKIPLITAGDEIIGIFPARLDKKFVVGKNTKRILKIKQL